MKIVIQRVREAAVIIEQNIYSNIKQGLCILIGIEEADDETDALWLAQKSVNMRIFSDTEGLMNMSVKDISGEILIISQFTLHASTKKGNRPSFIKAAKPDKAIALYEHFIKLVKEESNLSVKTGKFGSDMIINLINDGPVTIIIDSKNRE